MFTLDNRTPLPDEEIRELVSFGAGPVDLAHTHVVVRMGTSRFGWRGRAFWRLPKAPQEGWPLGTTYLIRLSLSSRLLALDPARWHRNLVEGAAHEAKHVEQFKGGRRHNQGLKTARALERECRDYQAARLAAYALESPSRLEVGLGRPVEHLVEGA